MTIFPLAAILRKKERGDGVFLEGRELAGQTGHEAGRKLLAQMYDRYVGGPLPEIRVADRGKPYFVDSPWHFSISHTPRHVFCALSERTIGIDAEEMDRDVRIMLADKILSPMEKAQYEESTDKQRTLLTFWVLKEARGKFTGEGLRGYPNHTQFSLPDPRVREMLGCLVAVMEEDDHVI